MTFKTFYYDQQVVVIFFFCFCLIRTVASSKGAALIHTLHSKDNILLEHKPLITMLFVHMRKKVCTVLLSLVTIYSEFNEKLVYCLMASIFRYNSMINFR